MPRYAVEMIKSLPVLELEALVIRSTDQHIF